MITILIQFHTSFAIHHKTTKSTFYLPLCTEYMPRHDKAFRLFFQNYISKYRYTVKLPYR